VTDWSDHSEIAFLTYLEDNTDERELPRRGRRFGLQYDAHLEDLSGRPPQRVAVSASGSLPSVRSRSRWRAYGGDQSGRSTVSALEPSRSHAGNLGAIRGGLYAPVAAGFGSTLAVRPAANLSFWAHGVVGLRGPTVREARRRGVDQGMEIGLLQRTPLGPILIGGHSNENADHSCSWQVGHDLAHLP